MYKVTDTLIKQNTEETEVVLQFRVCKLISLIKMKMLKNAAAEFEQMGDFNANHFFYQNNPNKFEGKKGNMVPFSLRLFEAELPGFFPSSFSFFFFLIFVL